MQCSSGTSFIDSRSENGTTLWHEQSAGTKRFGAANDGANVMGVFDAIKCDQNNSTLFRRFSYKIVKLPIGDFTKQDNDTLRIRASCGSMFEFAKTSTVEFGLG